MTIFYASAGSLALGIMLGYLWRGFTFALNEECCQPAHQFATANAGTHSAVQFGLIRSKRL